MAEHHTIDRRGARRLALLRGGLLKPDWLGLPRRAGRGHGAALRIIEHFGYLQLDTISIAGARSHALVLLSRLEDLDPGLPEQLLFPGATVFEYWGHEASWMPLELYGAFAFRRQAYRSHPWVRGALDDNRELARAIVRRIADEGPVKSADLEGEGGTGWWKWKTSKKVAAALWHTGELAIAERRAFQRTFDLTERTIPAEARADLSLADAWPLLLERALAGHGWASEQTLRATWRLRHRRAEFRAAMERLREQGRAVPCTVVDGGRVPGWIRPQDLEQVDRLARLRPRKDAGVLLSPFDPVLWDRKRVQQLFGFEMLLEVFKPAAQRRWGYFCLPVLAGEQLVARVDLKADRRARTLTVLSCHPEPGAGLAGREATRRALERHGRALDLGLVGLEA